MSIGEKIDNYYEDLIEVFNEEIDETFLEYRPYVCKIDLQPDIPLYKLAIYPMSFREEKVIKEYKYENLAKGFI